MAEVSRLSALLEALEYVGVGCSGFAAIGICFKNYAPNGQRLNVIIKRFAVGSSTPFPNL